MVWIREINDSKIEDEKRNNYISILNNFKSFLSEKFIFVHEVNIYYFNFQ